ncbi:MAG: hypothetical protein RJA07_2234 [Bacteroidota bacterium]|jgi:hypothetical protein
MFKEILEILKYTLPALIVFATAYYAIQSFLKNQLKIQEVKLKENTRHLTAPIRLQAYERLALLMERIDLFSLLQRVRTQNMTVADLQLMMINQIRMEWEHNLSQQIYVSNEIWSMVRSAKEETIMIINKFGMQLPPQAPSKELGKLIYEYLNELEGKPASMRTLDELKKESMMIL